MLLSEDEEWNMWNARGIDDMNRAEAIAFARAYAAEILAKLASAELPEPFYAISEMGKKVPYFTADQLRQAYAQGVASQLSAEPTAQITMDDDSYWFDPLIHLSALEDGTHKLYTRKEAK